MPRIVYGPRAKAMGLIQGKGRSEMQFMGFPPKAIKKGDDNMYKDLSHLSDEEIQILMDKVRW